jgi:hypothetical protein
MQAFLSMVPDGDGESITREQYKGKFCMISWHKSTNTDAESITPE